MQSYFAEFGHSERVYFTINETSNKQDLYKKNMVAMLYQ